MRRDLAASLLLATTAALIWAPLAVVAAAPNVLVDPTVAPSSGTTSTIFVLSVGYSSSAGTPAGTVSVAVAGRTVTMTLSEGTATNGTWSASLRLPLGLWTTTFSASPPKGNKPSILGPGIAVLAVIPSPVATATASPSATPVQSGGAVVEPNPGSSASMAPAPGASATPAPSGAAAPTGTATGSPAGTGSTATAAPGGGGAGGSGGGGSGGGATRASVAPAVSGPGAVPASPGPSASAAALGDAGSAERSATQLSILAIAGAGALAVLAAWFILLGPRRREDDTATVASGVQASGEETARPKPRGRRRGTAPDDPPVTPRAALRARIQPADDPILRAMGLGIEDALSGPRDPAPRERRVASGPGERPARRRTAGTSAADGRSGGADSPGAAGGSGPRRGRSR